MKTAKIIGGAVIAICAIAMIKTKDGPRDSHGNFDRMAKITCNEKYNITGTEYQCNQLRKILERSGKLEQYDNGNLISASKYHKDYQANEARADAMYKGKFIFIEGRVAEISKDFTDEPYLMLGKPNGYGTDWVRAKLADVHLTTSDLESKIDNPILSAEEKAISLNKGDKVEMTCVGDTMIIGVPTLERCVIQ